MDRIDISRDHPSLEDLLARAESGEAVEIARDGAVVATLTAVSRPAASSSKTGIDITPLRALVGRMRAAGVIQAESAIAELRKQARF